MSSPLEAVKRTLQTVIADVEKKLKSKENIKDDEYHKVLKKLQEEWKAAADPLATHSAQKLSKDDLSIFTQALNRLDDADIATAAGTQAVLDNFRTLKNQLDGIITKIGIAALEKTNKAEPE
ncbi:MAG: hypothetical protein KDK78_04205 [Chlamydiia bacterium]|nr:hypothetical protein [Chlamydiia bacterium]